jgi:putative tryptophan/tyrosine transport system substrate-binding protein
MPVTQPIKLEFVLNLKTAKAIGLNIAPAFLALTDDTIE